MKHTYGSPIYTHYAVKTHDLQLMSNLLKVGAIIKSKNLQGKQIEEFILENRTKYFNEYTGKPYIWDSETKTLSFDGPNQADNADQRKLQL